MRLAIEELLDAGEGQRVEFKSQIGDGVSIARAVCGLLNANGGVVVVGVSDGDRNGTFSNSAMSVEKSPATDFTEEDARRVERVLRKRISPAAMFSTSLEEVGGRHLVSIEVPSGPDKPYVCENKIYVRVGS